MRKLSVWVWAHEHIPVCLCGNRVGDDLLKQSCLDGNMLYLVLQGEQNTEDAICKTVLKWGALSAFIWWTMVIQQKQGCEVETLYLPEHSQIFSLFIVFLFFPQYLSTKEERWQIYNIISSICHLGCEFPWNTFFCNTVLVLENSPLV